MKNREWIVVAVLVVYKKSAASNKLACRAYFKIENELYEKQRKISYSSDIIQPL